MQDERTPRNDRGPSPPRQSRLLSPNRTSAATSRRGNPPNETTTTNIMNLLTTAVDEMREQDLQTDGTHGPRLVTPRQDQQPPKRSSKQAKKAPTTSTSSSAPKKEDLRSTTKRNRAVEVPDDEPKRNSQPNNKKAKMSLEARRLLNMDFGPKEGGTLSQINVSEKRTRKSVIALSSSTPVKSKHSSRSRATFRGNYAEKEDDEEDDSEYEEEQEEEKRRTEKVEKKPAPRSRATSSRTRATFRKNYVEEEDNDEDDSEYEEEQEEEERRSGIVDKKTASGSRAPSSRTRATLRKNYEEEEDDKEEDSDYEEEQEEEETRNGKVEKKTALRSRAPSTRSRTTFRKNYVEEEDDDEDDSEYEEEQEEEERRTGTVERKTAPRHNTRANPTQPNQARVEEEQVQQEPMEDIEEDDDEQPPILTRETPEEQESVPVIRSYPGTNMPLQLQRVQNYHIDERGVIHIAAPVTNQNGVPTSSQRVQINNYVIDKNAPTIVLNTRRPAQPMQSQNAHQLVYPYNDHRIRQAVIVTPNGPVHPETSVKDVLKKNPNFFLQLQSGNMVRDVTRRRPSPHHLQRLTQHLEAQAQQNPSGPNNLRRQWEMHFEQHLQNDAQHRQIQDQQYRPGQAQVLQVRQRQPLPVPQDLQNRLRQDQHLRSVQQQRLQMQEALRLQQEQERLAEEEKRKEEQILRRDTNRKQRWDEHIELLQFRRLVKKGEASDEFLEEKEEQFKQKQADHRMRATKTDKDDTRKHLVFQFSEEDLSVETEYIGFEMKYSFQLIYDIVLPELKTYNFYEWDTEDLIEFFSNARTNRYHPELFEKIKQLRWTGADLPKFLELKPEFVLEDYVPKLPWNQLRIVTEHFFRHYNKQLRDQHARARFIRQQQQNELAQLQFQPLM